MARNDVLEAAFAELTGAGVLLDRELRVVHFTPDALGLVSSLEHGASAPRLLCGRSEERPIAEALAAGRPVIAQIARTSGGAEHVLDVRAHPLEVSGSRVGWMLLLEPVAVGTADDEGVVDAWGLLTRSAVMKKVVQNVTRAARSDAPVLVRGETGSGKELVARALHSASKRSTGPFRAINCAALPPTLLESELFGHVEGAFTGATRDVPGHFRLADGGTLFLDEVAELSLELQAKLLRVVQESNVIPIGGREAIDVDVRIVAATHRSLRRAVQRGRFRADLMYRLRVIPLFLPPLRERVEDVELLARHFVQVRNQLGGRHVARVSAAARRALERYPWPGNVRELQNSIEYAFVMGDGPILTEADLPPEVRGDQTLPSDDAPAIAVELPSDAPAELPVEARRIAKALARADGHRERAAKSLGISRATLWRRMTRYGLH